jgi:hypothetical protein
LSRAGHVVAVLDAVAQGRRSSVRIATIVDATVSIGAVGSRVCRAVCIGVASATLRARGSVAVG